MSDEQQEEGQAPSEDVAPEEQPSEDDSDSGEVVQDAAARRDQERQED